MGLEAAERGMALMMVLIVQFLLALLGLAALGDGHLQQKIVAAAWQGQADRWRLTQSLLQAEALWQQGGLTAQGHIGLGITHHDCALADWLAQGQPAASWLSLSPDSDHRDRFIALAIEWQQGACQSDSSHGPAYTLLVMAQTSTHPPSTIQSVWLGQPAERVFWRMGD